MTIRCDAVVIGGGIVGAACAYELSRKGLQVVIVEREIIGGGTTAAGMGHIVVMDDSPAQLALTQYSQSLWNALSPSLPPPVEYDRCGTLWVAADEEEMAEVWRKHKLYKAIGVQSDVLDSASLAEAEPNLRRRACKVSVGNLRGRYTFATGQPDRSAHIACHRQRIARQGNPCAHR